MLVLTSACARHTDPELEPRGRRVCATANTPPASYIRPGDRAIDLRWCGTPPFPERGHWLHRNATPDAVFGAFPTLGHGLVLVEVRSRAGERNPSGSIRTVAHAVVVDGVSVLKPGPRLGSAGVAVPFTFDSGVVTVDGVVLRGPGHENAAVRAGRRYLFVYAQNEGFLEPFAPVAWNVDEDGRVGTAVGGIATRPWMKALTGRPVAEILDALERTAAADRAR